ncbi:MAG TPA: glycosyltransferase family A protein [Candidatus Limnocylindrales bacterium]|nr:glycosyltransferase family A protein [Candidatus Limnocylindrales bacterium]
MAERKPLISVITPTCDRPDDLRRSLDSLSRVTYPDWELILVDQSHDDASELIGAQFEGALPRLVYERIGLKGSSRARNVGMRLASGDLFAFFDDDCTITPDWLDQVAATFARHPEAALVCGTVASALDATTTFVPEFRVSSERVLSGRMSGWHARGIGAAMYVRREAAERVGPWDEQLGNGGRFKACGDWDYAYRLLRLGSRIVLTPAVVVRHYGGRNYKDQAASRLWRSIAYAQGALIMKHLRCGDPIAPVWILVQGKRHLAMARPLNLVRRGRSSHLARLAFYVRGLVASFALPVDRKRRLYLDASARAAGSQAIGRRETTARGEVKGARLGRRPKPGQSPGSPGPMV